MCDAWSRRLERCTLPPLHTGDVHEHDSGSTRVRWPIVGAAKQDPRTSSRPVIAVFAASPIPRADASWWALLDEARELHGITEVWHGVTGVGDESVELWATTRGLAVERFPSPTELYRRTKRKPVDADPRRISDMLHGKRSYKIDGRDEVVATEDLGRKAGLVVVLPEDQHTRRVARDGARLGLPVVRLQLEPVVVNRHHYPEGLPDGAMYIGRGTPLGNPIAAPKDQRTPEVITNVLAEYETHVIERLKAHDRSVLRALESITRDSVLVCSCKRPDGSGPCHGDVVLKLWRVAKRRKQRHG